jgi:4-oxalocrotonate tautomerase
MAVWTTIRPPHQIPHCDVRSSYTKDLRLETLDSIRSTNSFLKNVNYREKHLCLKVFEVPVVQVNVWTGISVENKKKIVEGITKVLEEIGVPREAITVIIYEEPKENWASGGKLHSERFANLGNNP